MSHLFFRHRFGDRETGVVLADVPLGIAASAVAEALYLENQVHLIHCDILVVRQAVGRASADLAPFRKRAPKAALYHLRLEGSRIKLVPDSVPRGQNLLRTKRERQEFVNAIRQAELLHFLRDSSALFVAPIGTTFRSPSGKFCRAFIRAGSVQRGRHQIDAIAFWLLPHLARTGALLTDTWSISSVALNAVRVAARAFTDRGEIDCEFLESYQDGAAGTTALTKRMLARSSKNGRRRVLILISTVMTGRSADRIREHVVNLGMRPDRFSFLSIYRLNKEADIDCLCDLSGGVDGVAFEVSDKFVRGETIIEIDRKAYFPLHLSERAVRIRTSKIGRETRDFFTRYQGRNVFAVHKDATESNQTRLRHHAFYVDVERLLEVREYKRRLTEVLVQCERRPAYIVVPPHPSGLRLAAEAQAVLQKRFGALTPILRSRYLDRTGPDDSRCLRSLRPDDDILIVDDVSITGLRLARFQTRLRSLYRGRINYLIGVARPKSLGAWERRQRDLEYRDGPRATWHRVWSVETVALPDWDEHECPWCKEESLLGEMMQSVAREDPSYMPIAHRRRHLVDARSNNGLYDDAVWRPSGHGYLRLTKGSIFLQARKAHRAVDADVFTAVASMIQLHRGKSDGLRSDYPLSSVINHSDYLTTTFTDAILRVAFLRVARRSELVRVKAAMELARASAARLLVTGEGVVATQDRAALVLEMAVAVLLGRLPIPQLTEDDWATLPQSAPFEILRLATRSSEH